MRTASSPVSPFVAVSTSALSCPFFVPFFQKVFVFDQDGGAVTFVLPLLPDGFSFGDNGGGRGTRVDPEILGQFLGRVIIAEPIQVGNEIDHVAGFVAAEAVIPFVHLHRGVLVAVKGAADHAVAIDLESVILRGLAGSDRRFDRCKNVVHKRFLLR